MDYTSIFFSDASKEAKLDVANNMIKIYELPLNTEQILLAFKNVLDWFAILSTWSMDSIKNNRILLFNRTLNTNKNMYIALILALCDEFNPDDLCDFFLMRDGGVFEIVDIGVNVFYHDSAMKNYQKLLDYYEFDVNDISTISEKDKETIQTYSAEKYSCKLTKCAIKK